MRSAGSEGASLVTWSEPARRRRGCPVPRSPAPGARRSRALRTGDRGAATLHPGADADARRPAQQLRRQRRQAVVREHPQGRAGRTPYRRGGRPVLAPDRRRRRPLTARHVPGRPAAPRRRRLRRGDAHHPGAGGHTGGRPAHRAAGESHPGQAGVPPRDAGPGRARPARGQAVGHEGHQGRPGSRDHRRFQRRRGRCARQRHRGRPPRPGRQHRHREVRQLHGRRAGRHVGDRLAPHEQRPRHPRRRHHRRRPQRAGDRGSRAGRDPRVGEGRQRQRADLRRVRHLRLHVGRAAGHGRDQQQLLHRPVHVLVLRLGRPARREARDHPRGDLVDRAGRHSRSCGGQRQQGPHPQSARRGRAPTTAGP